MMIDHHHVRFRRAAPGLEQEAGFEVRALEPRTEIGLRGDLVPDLGAGQDRQVG
jgi:hypothetical protein